MFLIGISIINAADKCGGLQMSDIIIRHRLFWSFFILGTEKWLDGMSSTGFNLFDLDFNGNFKFKQGEPHNCNYIFSYAKFEPSQKLSPSSKLRGWEQIAHHEKWSLYRGEKKAVRVKCPTGADFFCVIIRCFASMRF